MFALLGHTALALSLLLRQEPPAARAAVGAGASQTDSLRVDRGARSAQSAFEAFRRNRLPITWGGGSGGTCDTRIGRYCYWRGDEDEETPPLEAPAIRARRIELVRTLDSGAHVLPGADWIAGQRIRYLVEADRAGDAIHAAQTECRASVSWCQALAGYAAHVDGRFATADSAFELALAAMDNTERCRWFDISNLLSDELESRFKALDCAGREAFARRLLWLGAPLYSVSSTDLLTEHFARLTRARLSEHASSPDGEAWGDDMRELVLRYGWPRWHTRGTPNYGWEDQPSITGHDAGVPYDFLPSMHAVEHAGHLTDGDWQLNDPRAHMGYAPSYARTVHEIPHQIAIFRRGDSALVVAAWDGRADTTLIGRRLDAALALVEEGRPAVVARQTGVSLVGRIAATAPIDSGIASLELFAAADRRAARARVGLPPGMIDGLALSSLLLYSPGDASPDSLGAVSGDALPSDVVTGARAVGVFWEAYGVQPSAGPVEFALSVEQIDVDWMHRAAATIHLADPAAELRVRWEEVPAMKAGIAARGIRLDLSRLRAGRYRIELTVTSVGGGTAVATRDVHVE
jgi:hypothetical protein